MIYLKKFLASLVLVFVLFPIFSKPEQLLVRPVQLAVANYSTEVIFEEFIDGYAIEALEISGIATQVGIAVLSEFFGTQDVTAVSLQMPTQYFAPSNQKIPTTMSSGQYYKDSQLTISHKNWNGIAGTNAVNLNPNRVKAVIAFLQIPSSHPIEISLGDFGKNSCEIGHLPMQTEVGKWSKITIENECLSTSWSSLAEALFHELFHVRDYARGYDMSHWEIHTRAMIVETYFRTTNSNLNDDQLYAEYTRIVGDFRQNAASDPEYWNTQPIPYDSEFKSIVNFWKRTGHPFEF